MFQGGSCGGFVKNIAVRRKGTSFFDAQWRFTLYRMSEVRLPIILSDSVPFSQPWGKDADAPYKAVTVKRPPLDGGHVLYLI